MNSNRTAFQKELNFTTEQGIKIQTDQLNELKCVLFPEAYTMLQSLATAKNESALDGFDVLRGVDMYNILSNEVVPFFLSKKSESENELNEKEKDAISKVLIDNLSNKNYMDIFSFLSSAMKKLDSFARKL